VQEPQLGRTNLRAGPYQNGSLSRASWPVPPIFDLLVARGEVSATHLIKVLPEKPRASHLVPVRKNRGPGATPAGHLLRYLRTVR
jgi:hypothetical protein